jgi:hypothetical protein
MPETIGHTWTRKEWKRITRICAELGPKRPVRPLTRWEAQLFPMPFTAEDYRRIAHHEAAHAVAGVVGGYPPVSAEVYRHGALRAGPNFDPRDPFKPGSVIAWPGQVVSRHAGGDRFFRDGLGIGTLPAAGMWAYVLLGLAGEAADRRLGAELDDRQRIEINLDRQQVAQILGVMNIDHPTFGATQERAEREADALVREHWPAIERVAGALLERGRLEGADVEALTGGGAPNASAPGLD